MPSFWLVIVLVFARFILSTFFDDFCIYLEISEIMTITSANLRLNRNSPLMFIPFGFGASGVLLRVSLVYGLCLRVVWLLC